MQAQVALANPGPVTERVTGFMRLARDHDFSAGIAETLDAQQLVAACGLDQRQQIRWGLRALVCGDHNQWQRFDELFDSYWLPANATALQGVSGAAGGQPQVQEEGGGASESVTDSGDGNAADADPGGAQAGASAHELLQRADFSALVDAGQQRAVEQEVELLARRLRKCLVRRQFLQRKGRVLAMRSTIRQSLRYGGTPLALRFRRRRAQLPRVVLITDVSRSMSIYSHFFLRFARGVLRVFGSADAFAVHSRLVPISEALRQPDSARLAESLALISLGWSGGTRLGESLATFNRDYGRLLNRRSLVVVVSDGLDTGDPAELGRQMAQLKARARRLVWLNPLLGRAGYEPLAGSMQAALPHIDLFAPAHNLESLAALEAELAAL
jgi:uncharacterized protein with von Willebrand factor type A (vWA) domain